MDHAAQTEFVDAANSRYRCRPPGRWNQDHHVACSAILGIVARVGPQGLLMTRTDRSLLELAQENAPSDPDTSQCWDFVLRGIEVGWLGVRELNKLKHQLDGFNDYGVEELMFSNREDSTIKVEFLDDSWICSAELLRSALGKLIAAIPA